MNFDGGLVDAWGTINAAIINGANLQPALGGTGLTVNGRVALLASSQLTFQLGGLTQGSEYGHLNINGTLALGGQLALTFANGFQNLVTNDDDFTVLNALGPSTGNGRFTNVASGGRLWRDFAPAQVRDLVAGRPLRDVALEAGVAVPS
jgi:hypothetical protein